MAAGQQLKLFRNKRNITVREVEQASRRIAEAKADRRYQISNGWLAQLENGVSEPSIFKFFTLAATYRVKLWELLRVYGVDINEQQEYEAIANPQLTQLLSQKSVSKWALDRATSGDATTLVLDLARKHAAPPDGSPNNGDAKVTYGYLGLKDLTMYPLIRPGSLLEIDTHQNRLQTPSWHNEFERPIYFVELREGYACGWCELQGNQLLIIPHHSSTAKVRRFTFPREAEIVGRVVSYYTRCVDHEREKSTRA
ncbi:MAG: helix-turn-helix domain-containing protein [Pyrinomonadaceae bacterium]